MCGICGVINFNKKPVAEAQIRNMMLRMKHRGPDDEGTFVKDNIGLGFVRLSIIDLSAGGHQPKFSHDGAWCWFSMVKSLITLRSVRNFVKKDIPSRPSPIRKSCWLPTRSGEKNAWIDSMACGHSLFMTQ